MSFDQWIKLIGLLLPLLQSLIWPTLILVILLLFRGVLKKFIENIGEFSGKVSATGVEISAKKEIDALTASAALGAASASQPENEQSHDKEIFDDEKAREIAEVVSEAVTPQIARRLADATILWIDTLPLETIYEKIALGAIGIQIHVTSSFKDAAVKISNNKYNCIVLGIPLDQNTTEVIHEFLQVSQKVSTAFAIIYGTYDAELAKQELLRQKIYAVTNKPKELFESVIRAIETQPVFPRMKTPSVLEEYQKVEDIIETWLHERYSGNMIVRSQNNRTINIPQQSSKFDFLMIENNGNNIGIEVKNKFAVDLRSITRLREKAIRGPIDMLSQETWYILVYPNEGAAGNAKYKLEDLILDRKLEIKKEESFLFGYIRDNNQFIHMSTIPKPAPDTIEKWELRLKERED